MTSAHQDKDQKDIVERDEFSYCINIINVFGPQNHHIPRLFIKNSQDEELSLAMALLLVRKYRNDSVAVLIHLNEVIIARSSFNTIEEKEYTEKLLKVHELNYGVKSIKDKCFAFMRLVQQHATDHITHLLRNVRDCVAVLDEKVEYPSSKENQFDKALSVISVERKLSKSKALKFLIDGCICSILEVGVAKCASDMFYRTFYALDFAAQSTAVQAISAASDAGFAFGQAVYKIARYTYAIKVMSFEQSYRGGLRKWTVNFVEQEDLAGYIHGPRRTKATCAEYLENIRKYYNLHNDVAAPGLVNGTDLHLIKPSQHTFLHPEIQMLLYFKDHLQNLPLNITFGLSEMRCALCDEFFYQFNQHATVQQYWNTLESFYNYQPSELFDELKFRHDVYLPTDWQLPSDESNSVAVCLFFEKLMAKCMGADDLPYVTAFEDEEVF